VNCGDGLQDKWVVIIDHFGRVTLRTFDTNTWSDVAVYTSAGSCAPFPDQSSSTGDPGVVADSYWIAWPLTGGTEFFSRYSTLLDELPDADDELSISDCVDEACTESCVPYCSDPSEFVIGPVNVNVLSGDCTPVTGVVSTCLGLLDYYIFCANGTPNYRTTGVSYGRKSNTCVGGTIIGQYPLGVQNTARAMFTCSFGPATKCAEDDPDTNCNSSFFPIVTPQYARDYASWGRTANCFAAPAVTVPLIMSSPTLVW
jgi:hypothetical protein